MCVGGCALVGPVTCIRAAVGFPWAAGESAGVLVGDPHSPQPTVPDIPHHRAPIARGRAAAPLVCGGGAQRQ